MNKQVDESPQVKAFLTDEHEQEASRLYKKFNEKKTTPELLLQASEQMLQSSNPEAKQISIMYRALYFREMGLKDNNDKKARKWLQKSSSEFKKVVPESDVILKRVELEFLKRKLGSKLQRPDPKVILRRATLYKELEQDQAYNQEMSLYYMFLMMDQPDQLNSQDTLGLTEKMLDHAKKGMDDELIFKIKALYHRVRANAAYNPKDRAKELEQAVVAISKTTDKFGEESTETEAMMAKALLTPNRDKRNTILSKVAEDYEKRGLKKQESFARNLLSPVPVKAAKIIYLCDKSLEKLKKIEKKLLDMKTLRKPAALFYHIGYFMKRIKDVQRIMMSMALARKELTELQIKMDSLTPTKIIPGKPFAKRLQVVSNKRDRLGEQMGQDMESLLIYGNMLLDQWSYIVGYIAGYEAPKSHGKLKDDEKDLHFAGLYYLLHPKEYSGELSTFWKSHKKDIIWLFYHLRQYRNIFIEHMRKPWQLGSTMASYGDDFNFHIPAPVGYVDESEKKKILEEVYKLAPQRLKDMPDDYWEKKNLHRVLEVTLYYIEELEDQADREKVWRAWDKLGGSTPSYDAIGARLLNYISSSLDSIDSFIDKYPKLIKFGEFK